jgi:hypothetical protein
MGLMMMEVFGNCLCCVWVMFDVLISDGIVKFYKKKNSCGLILWLCWNGKHDMGKYVGIN